tara:strand:+ start:1260 stop:1493 length:234 start_codon:yes stop_codon:yes gene_type:complete
MKDLALKSLFLLSVFVMVDYFIMILVGCISNYAGCTTTYFECTFCTIGKFVFAISAILFVFMMRHDFKSIVAKPKSD